MTADALKSTDTDLDQNHVTALEAQYDRFLGEHLSEVREYLAAHGAQLEQHGIHPGDFQLPLRPMFLSRRRYARLQHSVATFFEALLKTFWIGFGGELRRIAPLLQLDEAVCQCLERHFVPERTLTELYGRPDGFFWNNTVQFIEQNVTSGPGGLPGIDALSGFFGEFPALQALRNHARITRFSPMDAYVARFTGPPLAHRRIGYLDALDPQTGGLWDDEGLRFLRTLADRGVTLVNLTDRTLVRTEGGLTADGAPIDVVYRGCAALGLWFRMGELQPLFEACGHKHIEMILSPYEMVLFDKMLLPYLSDERLNGFFSHAERRALSEIVPWTRILREEPTTWQDRTLGMEALCLEAQEHLVIKKGNGFGSEAVVVGSECSAQAWSQAVRRGLDQGNWIVQALVDPPKLRLPYLVQGELVWTEGLSMTCPYIVAGVVSGIGGRTSIPAGSRILVGAGQKGSRTGIRTAFLVD